MGLMTESIKEITYNDVLLINSLCLFDNEPFRVVDKNKILSALGNQYQPYPNDESSFSSIYKSLVINHGFINGNKRTAVIVLYLSSLMIGNKLKLNDEQLVDLTYKIAGEVGSQIEAKDIAKEAFSKVKKHKYRKIDIAKETTSFIESHEWLMKELGK